jgi:hypothetical protein
MTNKKAAAIISQRLFNSPLTPLLKKEGKFETFSNPPIQLKEPPSLLKREWVRGVS